MTAWHFLSYAVILSLMDFSNGLMAVIMAAVFFLALFLGRLLQSLIDRKKIREAREDAVRRSRAVLGGQLAEQVAPFLPGFPCNPADARFIGKPVDFIAFPGSAEGAGIEEVLLIEVKSGKGSLSTREKEVRAAVEKGRVRYVEYRVPGSTGAR